MEEIKEYLPLIIPLVVVQIILLVVSIRHIMTHDHYKRGSRVLWIAIVIIGMQIWGPVLYFILGKEDD
ncbi:MAG: PLDc N-terminal domain-containing protein [Clostridiaceae bacterium]